jgi:chromate transporter
MRAISGAAFVLGHRAIIDLPTIAIFLAAPGLLSFVRKLPEPALVLAAGIACLT